MAYWALHVLSVVMSWLIMLNIFIRVRSVFVVILMVILFLMSILITWLIFILFLISAIRVRVYRILGIICKLRHQVKALWIILMCSLLLIFSKAILVLRVQVVLQSLNVKLLTFGATAKVITVLELIKCRVIKLRVP